MEKVYDIQPISYRRYRQLLENPDTNDSLIEKYSIVTKGEGAFEFRLHPNPDLVEMQEHEMELENALGTANDIARWRRKQKFKKRLKKGTDLPIIVSEGDSWFQFPLIIKDVVDHLKKDYLIYSVGAAGDTADNMVFGEESSRHTEYLLALRKLRDKGHTVSGFMFSGAGNDIIGEDPKTGISALQDIIRDFNGDPTDITGHINFSVFVQRLNRLQLAYLKVISSIRSEPGFHDLPIFIHGYDYVFPYEWENDERDPFHAKKKQWLGDPLDARKIFDRTLRRGVIKLMLDMLYDMLNDIAKNSVQTHVWVVDCRGAMPSVSDWVDEIHGTDDGFAKVAKRFRATLKTALAPSLLS